MGRTDTEEYGAWEDGHTMGLATAKRILELAEKLNKKGSDAESILEYELNKDTLE